MKIFVIMAAGGSGTRMKEQTNKIFLPIGGQPVLLRSIRLFDQLADEMIIVCKNEEQEEVEKIAASSSVSFPIRFAEGGRSRQDSVFHGLKAIQASSEDIVLVHDAARCMTPAEVIRKVIYSCVHFRSGVPGIPAVSTMKICNENHCVVSTPDRSSLFEIQTPQGFRYGDLLRAYQLAEEKHYQGTDDASLVEYTGESVYITEGSRINMKITEKEDYRMAQSFLGSGFIPRVGTGFDVHRLVKGRKLILCGVEIPHESGLLGHSDADVALHALMDAMLGAAALGDIGKHFPDSSESFKDISSLVLLKKVCEMIGEAGYEIGNADITIVAQQPKISPYIEQMRTVISMNAGCERDRISVKATTTEKLGFEGRMEGISAQAVCLLIPRSYTNPR